MPDTTHVVAGRWTTVFEGTREQEQHGDMLVVVKPDSTSKLLVDLIQPRWANT